MLDILGSIGNAITLANRLKEISDNIKDAELKNILADLSLELADTKLKLAEIITENVSLKEQVNILESRKINIEELTFRDGLYYRKNDDNPFCTGCYDNNKKEIRLQRFSAVNTLQKKMGNLICPICETYYTKN